MLRHPISFTWFFAACTASFAIAADTPLQPLEPFATKNILFIVSDDLNDVLGCYGGPAITPHLDELAARGTLFESAYCQVPWCSPSRSSFLTGRKPDVVNVHKLPTADHPRTPHFRDAVPRTVTNSSLG